MWTDQSQMSPEKSASGTVKKLLDRVLVLNRSDLLQMDERHQVRSPNGDEEQVNLTVSERGYRMRLYGRPYKMPYLDGKSRFNLTAEVKTYFLSPQQTREMYVDVFSEDLEDWEIHRFIETRTANLEGGAVYKRVFLKQVHMTPDPRFNQTKEFEEVVVPYSGPKLTMTVFDGEKYKKADIDSIMYEKDENGMWTKTYGVLEEGLMSRVEVKGEYRRGYTQDQLDKGKAPKEIYHRDVPVVGDELGKLHELLEKGRKVVGPRDTEMDKMVKVKR